MFLPFFVVCDQSTFINQLFSGGTALAGLILVFLGSVIVAYESYDTQAKKSVQAKYRKRAFLAFGGFIFALVSAVAAIITNWISYSFIVYISSGALGLSFILVIIVAAIIIRDI